MDTKEFIKKAKKIHGKKFDYSKSEYTGYNALICVICPKHGERFPSASNHLAGHGCRECQNEEKIERNGKKFFKLAKKLHGNSLDFSNSVYKGSKKEIIVRCPIHGDFPTTPDSLKQGCGCTKCGRKKAAKKKSSGKDNFVKKAESIHGKGTYDYSLVKYINSKTKVDILCRIHGKFSQRPEQHTRGQGCPKCGHEKSNEAKKLSPRDIIIRGRNKFGDKFSYNFEGYSSTKDDMQLQCNTCGHNFKQTPTDHFNCEEPCPVCGDRFLDVEVFLRRAEKVHKGKFTYPNLTFKYAKDKITVVCPEHGEFFPTVDNHLNGTGCPSCVEMTNSRGAKRIEAYLKANAIKFEKEKKFSSLKNTKGKVAPLEFDFFLIDLDILLEFDGRQHFEPVDIFGGEEGFKRLQENDRQKNTWVKNSPYKLIRIRHDHEEDIEIILDELLLTEQESTK